MFQYNHASIQIDYYVKIFIESILFAYYYYFLSRLLMASSKLVILRNSVGFGVFFYSIRLSFAFIFGGLRQYSFLYSKMFTLEPFRKLRIGHETSISLNRFRMKLNSLLV